MRNFIDLGSKYMWMFSLNINRNVLQRFPFVVFKLDTKAVASKRRTLQLDNQIKRNKNLVMLVLAYAPNAPLFAFANHRRPMASYRHPLYVSGAFHPVYLCLGYSKRRSCILFGFLFCKASGNHVPIRTRKTVSRLHVKWNYPWCSIYLLLATNTVGKVQHCLQKCVFDVDLQLSLWRQFNIHAFRNQSTCDL